MCPSFMWPADPCMHAWRNLFFFLAEIFSSNDIFFLGTWIVTIFKAIIVWGSGSSTAEAAWCLLQLLSMDRQSGPYLKCLWVHVFNSCEPKITIRWAGHGHKKKKSLDSIYIQTWKVFVLFYLCIFGLMVYVISLQLSWSGLSSSIESGSPTRPMCLVGVCPTIGPIYTAESSVGPANDLLDQEVNGPDWGLELFLSFSLLLLLLC